MRTKLLAAAPDVEKAATLIARFRALLRDRQADTFLPWLEAVDASGIPELVAFALSLRRDQAAVEAALTYEWSSGQVEGQVTKTKLIKRQMFGRKTRLAPKARAPGRLDVTPKHGKCARALLIDAPMSTTGR